MTRGLAFLAIAAAAVPFIQFLVIASSRLTYPFDVEWMEGAVLGHAIELLKTGRIYKMPSQDFVPLIYPPLYTYVVAAGIRLFGIGYTFARLVSVVSIVAAAGLGAAIVRRETESGVLSTLAFLGPFAMYGVTGYWFDLVRVDEVALLLVAGGLYSLLYASRKHGMNLIVCAVFLALAGFGKQSFFLFVAALVLYLAIARAWRDLIVFLTASAVAHAVLWGGLFLSEGKIAFTYIFEVPRTHGWWKKSFPDAVSLAFHHLFMFRPVLTVLTVTAFAVAWRPSWEMKNRLGLFGMTALSAVVISILTRAKWGGYENAFIPAYFFLGLLCFLAAGAVRGDRGRRVGRLGEAPAIVFLVMVVASSGIGALRIDVSREWVGRERRIAARQLAALVAAVDGRALIPSRNAAALSRRAADNHYHEMAVRDLSGCPALYSRFREDEEEGLRSGRFAAILKDAPTGILEGRFGYRRVTLDDLGIPSRYLSSMTGKETRPVYLYTLPAVDLEKVKRAVRAAGP